MKKLLLLFILHSLPAYLFAQIAIGDTQYDKLTDAVAASVVGDVIKISGPVMLTDQVGLGHSSGVKTFRGMTADASISLANGARFILEAAGETVFENLTLNGAEQANDDWGAMITLFNGPKLTLKNDTLRGAKTNAHAGAIRITSGATVNASHTVFIGNEAKQNGGVAFIEAGNTATLFDGCVFIGNKCGVGSSDAKGAALFYAYGGNMKDHIVKNSAFINNSSSNNGGAIGMESVSPFFINCTFSGNSAVDNGGVFWMWDSGTACTTTLINCTFDGNTAGNGAAMFMNQATTLYDLRNTVLASNGDKPIGSAVNPSTISITHSYFAGLPEGMTLSSGSKNVNGGDLYLAAISLEDSIVWLDITNPNSALVGLGDASLLQAYSTKDQVGTPRKMSKAICAGAIEYDGVVLGNYADVETLLRVYPNPATDHIVVKTTEKSSVSIFGINGTLMTKRIVGVGEHIFDVSTYGKNVYLLKSVSEKGTRYARFVVK